MNSAIPASCMDRYLNRYIVPPHSVQQQQQQQHQLLSQQQQATNQNVPPNGFFAHGQQQPQQHNFVVGCYSNASGWTGVPLISTAASRRPRKFAPGSQNVPAVNNNSHYQPAAGKPDFDESAMSRLALHAHGAPLILANSRYNRSNTNNNSNNKSGGLNKLNKVPLNLASREDHPLHQHHHNHHAHHAHHHAKMAQQNMGAAVHHQQQLLQHHQAMVGHLNDAHSVASDESGPHSGTTNSSSSSTSSDTCLPRIIKPRKRRKKDRKPAANNPITGGSTNTASTGTSTTAEMSVNLQAPTSMNSTQLQVNPLLLDETTRDFLHEIAMMANAGTPFDFSALPLIREQPQQLPQQLHPQQQQQQQHFSSSNSDSSDSGINSGSSGSLNCSCQLCNPFSKIWAFPLRRSCSDNSAEIELNRVKDVGVIGSNRSNSFRSEWRSSPHSLEQQHQGHAQQHQHDFGGSGSSRKGSFSDSGDSGCDLLSGLTFCSEDILSSVNRELFLTPVDAAKEFKFPVAGGGGGGGVGSVSGNSISGSGSPGSASVVSDNSGELLLISELTKKLNEGLDLQSSPGTESAGSSVFSADSSVFSGSSAATSGSEGSPPGADLFVNFDAISRNNLFSVNNISKLSNLLFDDGLTAPGLVISSGHGAAHNLNNNVLNNGTGNGSVGVNYIRSKNIQNLQQQQHLPPPPSTAAVTSTPQVVPSSSAAAAAAGHQHHHRSLFSDHQPFIFVPDADRGCEVLNGFDMVWSNNTSNNNAADRKLLPVEE